MIRVTLKGLLARKLRLALTSLAIVMGVGMVSGTYILTDTINASLGEHLGGAYAKADAVVTGRPPSAAATRRRSRPRRWGGSGRSPASRPPAARSAAQAEIVGADGKVVSARARLQFGGGVDPGYLRFSAFRLVAGAWPRGPGEVAIDAGDRDLAAASASATASA